MSSEVTAPAITPATAAPPTAAVAPEVIPAEAPAEAAVPHVDSTPATPAATTAPAPTMPTTEEPKPTDAAPKVEPQNALTKRFTEPEWAALKEFRKQLPEIFAEGFPDKEGSKTAPYTLWGVVIDPLKPDTDARVSVILIKFLRARNLNVKSAREMMAATLRWREEIDIDAVMKEEFPADVFGTLGYIYKTDKEGRPVSYNVYGGNKDTKAIFSDVRRFIRWRVQLMENTVAKCDFVTVDQTVQIHDYDGVGMSNRDPNSKQAASEATNVFSSHYPELLYKKFFINVSTLMSWIFWVFKTIIPGATFAKMNMIGTSTHDIKKALLPIIDEQSLPKRYGGLAEGF